MSLTAQVSYQSKDKVLKQLWIFGFLGGGGGGGGEAKNGLNARPPLKFVNREYHVQRKTCKVFVYKFAVVYYKSAFCKEFNVDFEKSF